MLMGSMKNKPNTTIYISNLNYKRDKIGIRNLCSRYGTVLNIKIVVEPQTNQSRGMAFVQMETLEEAKKAIDGLDGEVIDGRTIKANYAIPQDPERTPKAEKGVKKPARDKSL